MKAGCCAGCPPAVFLDEAGGQPALLQSASPKPQSLSATARSFYSSIAENGMIVC